MSNKKSKETFFGDKDRQKREFNFNVVNKKYWE